MAGRRIAVGGRRCLALGALFACLPLAGAARAEEPEPDSKRFWIAGAYLSVEARSPQAVLSGVADAAEALKAGLGKQMREALAGALGFGDAAALELIGGDRPAGLLLLNPRRGRGGYVFAVGDAGSSKLIGSVARLMGENAPGDLELDEFMLGDGDNVLYLRHAPPWMLGAPDPGALDAATRALKRGRVPRAPAARAQIALHADLRELHAAYGDRVEGGLQVARAAMTAGPVFAQFGEGAPVLARLLQAEVDAVEAVYKGFAEVDLALHLSKESMDVTVWALPAPESVFAPLAAEQKPASFVPARALPEGGMVAMAWRTERAATAPLVEALAGAVARVATGVEPEEEELERYRKLMGEWASGGFASAIVSDEGAMGSVWAGTKDLDSTRRMLSEGMEFANTALGPALKAMGLGMTCEYQEDVRRRKGERVDRMTITYRGEGEQAEQMKQMLGAMMGGMAQVSELAASGTGTVSAWGKDPAKALDEALARAEAPEEDYKGRAWPAASKELGAALERAPEATWLAFEVRMGGYISLMLDLMRKTQPAMALVVPGEDEGLKDLRDKDVPVVGWAASEKERLVFFERIPTAAVKNLVEFFEKMGQRFEGGRGRGGEPPPGIPGPDEPVEVW